MSLKAATDLEASPTRTRTAVKASPPFFGAIATTVCAVLGIVGAVFHTSEFTAARGWSIAACIGAYLAGGFGPTVNAVTSLRRFQLNVDLLMILAAIGAAAIGDWIEGVVLLFLFSLSGTLEAFAMYRTTRSIESLIQLRPREGLLVCEGVAEDQRVLVESLQIGDVVRVRPGERFAVDGLVWRWWETASMMHRPWQPHAWASLWAVPAPTSPSKWLMWC